MLYCTLTREWATGIHVLRELLMGPPSLLVLTVDFHSQPPPSRWVGPWLKTSVQECALTSRPTGFFPC